MQVLTHIVDLMTDPFGNYLVQKLLDRCSEQQRSDVLKEVSVPCSRLRWRGRGGMKGWRMGFCRIAGQGMRAAAVRCSVQVCLQQAEEMRGKGSRRGSGAHRDA